MKVPCLLSEDLTVFRFRRTAYLRLLRHWHFKRRAKPAAIACSPAPLFSCSFFSGHTSMPATDAAFSASS